MAWIELHDTVRNHRKTWALAVELKVPRAHAVGLLACLWTWSLTNAIDGNLALFPPAAIAEAAGWEKKPEPFIDALVKSGYVDEDLFMHDWDDYAGRLIEQRQEQKEYKQRQYALYTDLRLTRAIKQRDGDVCQYCGKTVNWKDRRGVDGGTYDHIDPDGGNELDNVVVCCRSCNSRKGRRTPEQANMQLLTDGQPMQADSRQVDGDSQVGNGQVAGRYQVDSRQISGRNTAGLRQVKSTITVPNLTVPNQTLPVDADDGGASCTRTREEDMLTRSFVTVFGHEPSAEDMSGLEYLCGVHGVMAVLRAIDSAECAPVERPVRYVKAILDRQIAEG